MNDFAEHIDSTYSRTPAKLLEDRRRRKLSFKLMMDLQTLEVMTPAQKEALLNIFQDSAWEIAEVHAGMYGLRADWLHVMANKLNGRYPYEMGIGPDGSTHS